eukprot:scaffold66426_cov71-Phaeocystis_antarctica.AAC.2
MSWPHPTLPSARSTVSTKESTVTRSTRTESRSTGCCSVTPRMTGVTADVPHSTTVIDFFTAAEAPTYA